LLDDTSTGGQEATMYHHNITLALAEARVADLQNAAAHSESTASPRRRHRGRLRGLALGFAAIAALLPAGALGQPIHDAATLAKAQADAVQQHLDPSATRASITFTNPLGRSRGPGAGAGLL
jgi:ferric-dicitrate binding protein FerR (iron transport regulator)